MQTTRWHAWLIDVADHGSVLFIAAGQPSLVFWRLGIAIDPSDLARWLVPILGLGW